jgi:hypothetical protein
VSAETQADYHLLWLTRQAILCAVPWYSGTVPQHGGAHRRESTLDVHLFDQYFDNDYLCELPLQGAGCPTKWTVFYFTPCPVPSCPAYEPNSIDGEYSQPFRHIQYKRTPNLRPIATLAMLLCRRIAK